MKLIKNIPDSAAIQILTDQNFQNKTRDGMVLVDFWAAWCTPCKLMVPVLNELAEETKGEVTIAKLNVDEQKATAAKYKIRSIPTMILFRYGKEIDRIVGVKSKDQLLKQIRKVR
jgi:thioredoxin 1